MKLFDFLIHNPWSDVVGIGFPKCGTGSLAFFDCHSKIIFREAEPDFWDRHTNSYQLKDYILPNASSDEILIGIENKNKNMVTVNLISFSLYRKNANHYWWWFRFIVSTSSEDQVDQSKNIRFSLLEMSDSTINRISVALCDPVKRFISHVRHSQGIHQTVLTDLLTVKEVKHHILSLSSSKPGILKWMVLPFLID